MFEQAIWLLMLVSFAQIFYRAGLKPWAVLIPGYGDYTLIKAVHRPIWWAFILVGVSLLLCVPLSDEARIPLGIVGFVVQALVSLLLVERFGKGTIYYLGVVFLPIIFLPMLAFGSADYKPPYKRRKRRRIAGTVTDENVEG